MEPERPIEKRLREYGKSRCERAGDLRLHPATRRLLHGEVERTLGTPHRSKPRFFGFWPKVVWSGGLLAAVVVIGIMSWPSQKSRFKMASNVELTVISNQPVLAFRQSKAETGQPEISSGTVALPAAAAVPPKKEERLIALIRVPEEKAKSIASKDAGVSSALLAAAPEPSTPITFGRSATVAATSATARRGGEVLADSLTPLAKESDALQNKFGTLMAGVAVTNGAPESLQAGTGVFKGVQEATLANAVIYERTDSNAGPVLRVEAASAAETQLARRFGNGSVEQDRSESFMANQGYVRTPTPQAMGAWKTVNNEARMLSNFRMQQTSTGLEVVDEDGSVYKGQLEPLADKTTAVARHYLGAQVNLAAGEQAMQFRVAGTNNSLGKPIVFSGQIMPQTTLLNNQAPAQNVLNNNVPGSPQGSNQTLNSFQGLNNQAQLILFQNSRISGKVRVGSEETEINAIPRNP